MAQKALLAILAMALLITACAPEAVKVSVTGTTENRGPGELQAVGTIRFAEIVYSHPRNFTDPEFTIYGSSESNWNIPIPAGTECPAFKSPTFRSFIGGVAALCFFDLPNLKEDGTWDYVPRPGWVLLTEEQIKTIAPPSVPPNGILEGAIPKFERGQISRDVPSALATEVVLAGSVANSELFRSVSFDLLREVQQALDLRDALSWEISVPPFVPFYSVTGDWQSHEDSRTVSPAGEMRVRFNPGLTILIRTELRRVDGRLASPLEVSGHRQFPYLRWESLKPDYLEQKAREANQRPVLRYRFQLEPAVITVAVVGTVAVICLLTPLPGDELVAAKVFVAVLVAQ